MMVNVLFFASLAERIGVREVEIELPLKSSAADVLVRLGERYPEVAAMREQLAVAVNLEYVASDWLLADGDEVALISPVSGG